MTQKKPNLGQFSFIEFFSLVNLIRFFDRTYDNFNLSFPASFAPVCHEVLVIRATVSYKKRMTSNIRMNNMLNVTH